MQTDQIKIILALIDLLKSAITSFPILILLTILIFKKPLESIINNQLRAFIENLSIKLTKGDSTIEIARQNQVQQKNVTEKKETEIAKIAKIAAKPTTEKDQKDAVIFYEKTYRLIFNSQLKILNMLNTTNPTLIVSEVYEIYKATIWNKSVIYSFQNYMGYLLASGLIDLDKKDNSYQITPTGKAFLKYLNENHMPLKKVPENY